MSLFNFLFGWHKLDISKKDFVLEVGSGGHPLSRSDVLLDKFIYDTTQRDTSSFCPIVIDRPFVCGDAEQMPFQDNAFDYIYCSMLLEHLNDPEAFLKECMRVGRKGYIVTPNEISEKIFGWDYHKNIVILNNDILVIKSKNKNNWGIFGGFFHELWKEYKDFKRIFTKYSSLFETHYEWKGKIKYKVEKNIKRKKSDNYQLSAPRFKNKEIKFKKNLERCTQSISSKLIRSYYSRADKPRLEEILCCPTCKGVVNFERDKNSISCFFCQRRYPIMENIPCMLPELATKIERP